jgi:hypothetical protein
VWERGTMEKGKCSGRVYGDMKKIQAFQNKDIKQMNNFVIPLGGNLNILRILLSECTLGFLEGWLPRHVWFGLLPFQCECAC